MDPFLIGYFPKRIAKRPDSLKVPGIRDICSVSECISGGPEGWINAWRHNDFDVFNDEDSAWSVVPEGRSNAAYVLFAYRLFPIVFDDGESRPYDIPPLRVQPLPTCYARLGFDAVSRSSGCLGFECSPLSCNSAAERFKVNAHCLVDTEDEVLRIAGLFSQSDEHYEPGPYYAVEVWRCGDGA